MYTEAHVSLEQNLPSDARRVWTTRGSVALMAWVVGVPTAYARLAQSAERKALNLVVVGSSPTVGVLPRPVAVQMMFHVV